jgi:hypothetical protein
MAVHCQHFFKDALRLICCQLAGTIVKMKIAVAGKGFTVLVCSASARVTKGVGKR